MIEAIYDATLKTGWIFLPMFLTGLLGWYMLLQVFVVTRQNKSGLSPQYDLFERQVQNDEWDLILARAGKADTIRKKFLKLLMSERDTSGENLAMLSRNFIQLELGSHTRTLSTAGLVATLAPLLGLIGTVSGMINTFKIISFYGSASPVLMAAGISEALLATQAGLAIAFPILFAHTILRSRLNKIRTEVEQYYARFYRVTHA